MSSKVGLLAVLVVALAPACGSVSPLSVDAGGGGTAAGGSGSGGGGAGGAGSGSGGRGGAGAGGAGAGGAGAGGAGAGGSVGVGGSGVPPAPCAMVTNQAECDARGDCHAVFEDPGTCGCAAIGCCARFVACAAGDRAHCTPGATLCRRAAPYCELPAYVVSYVDTCYEGCVRPADCE